MKRTAVLGWAIAVMTAPAVAATPSGAQQTRTAPQGHVPPPATIADVEWLRGLWEGKGIDGADAVESWLPASTGAMVGTFVQEKPDDTILFTEHMVIAEEAGSLVLKLKHFNPDLTGWEEKDGMVRFPLVSAQPCALHFSGLSYRCDGSDGLVVAVRMERGGEQAEELVFRFKRTP